MANGPLDCVNMGAIQIAIWGNEYKGNMNYSVTISKRYKKDNKWENTNFLNKADTLVAALGLQEAFKKIGVLQSGGATGTTEEEL